MNYLDKIAVSIYRLAEDKYHPNSTDMILYRAYALLALAKGEATTLEDVHNTWVIWASDYDMNSWSLVPFEKLDASVQQKDQPYVEIIHKVAQELKEEVMK